MLAKKCSTKQSQLINKSSDLLIKLTGWFYTSGPGPGISVFSILGFHINFAVMIENFSACLWHALVIIKNSPNF